MFSGDRGTRWHWVWIALRRLNKFSIKEIFESEDTLFRKKTGFAFKEDCKGDISKQWLNEVEKTLAKELGGWESGAILWLSENEEMGPDYF